MDITDQLIIKLELLSNYTIFPLIRLYTYTSHHIQLISISATSYTAPDCYDLASSHHFGYWGTLLLATLGPIALIVLLIVVWAGERALFSLMKWDDDDDDDDDKDIDTMMIDEEVEERRLEKMKYKYITAVLVVLFVILPSTTLTIFQAFSCTDVDPDNVDSDSDLFLEADLTVDCSTQEYHKIRTYAIIMILVYPLGVPLLYFLALYTIRDEISVSAEETKKREREAIEDATHDADDAEDSDDENKEDETEITIRAPNTPTSPRSGSTTPIILRSGTSTPTYPRSGTSSPNNRSGTSTPTNPRSGFVTPTYPRSGTSTPITPGPERLSTLIHFISTLNTPPVTPRGLMRIQGLIDENRDRGGRGGRGHRGASAANANSESFVPPHRRTRDTMGNRGNNGERGSVNRRVSAHQVRRSSVVVPITHEEVITYSFLKKFGSISQEKIAGRMVKTPLAKSIQFLYTPYSPAFWYWELVETARRLILTALLHISFKGSVGQVIIGLTLNASFIALYTYCKCYVERRDKRLSVLGQLLVFVTFLAVMAVRGEKWTSTVDALLVLGVLVFVVRGLYVAVMRRKGKGKELDVSRLGDRDRENEGNEMDDQEEDDNDIEGRGSARKRRSVSSDDDDLVEMELSNVDLVLDTNYDLLYDCYTDNTDVALTNPSLSRNSSPLFRSKSNDLGD